MDSASRTRPFSVLSGVGVGDLLGARYRLQGLLGRGGMAQVFTAADEVLQRQVAVKVFPSEELGAGQVSRGQGEVRILASLNHPGLVTVYDAGTHGVGVDAATFLVMELVPGPALARQLQTHGPLDWAQAAALGAQVARALAYVHGRNLVHRDVKPANILLDKTITDPGLPLVAKLADFGIARIIDATRLTLTGTTLGTAPYLSPEQVRGQPVGPPTDVYALGLVLLECLTGNVAYPGNAVESAVARLHRPPHIPHDLGASWSDLLVAMTETDAAARPSAQQVSATLRANFVGPDQVRQTQLRGSASTQVLPTSEAVAPAATTAFPSPSRRPRRAVPRRALVAAVAAAVLLAGLGVMAWGGGSGPPPPPPSYPSVTGQLGTDLNQLQKAVQP